MMRYGAWTYRVAMRMKSNGGQKKKPSGFWRGDEIEIIVNGDVHLMTITAVKDGIVSMRNTKGRRRGTWWLPYGRVKTSGRVLSRPEPE